MNNMDKRFSDEFLNSFVDNQLTPEEKSHAYIEIARDEAVNRQVCELRKLHDLVQLAYREVPPPPASGTSSGAARRSRLRFGVAASILLAIGVTLGLRIDIPKPAQTAVAVVQPAQTQPVATMDSQPKPASLPVMHTRAVTVAVQTAKAAPTPATGATIAAATVTTVPAATPADPQEAALSSYQIPVQAAHADRNTSRVLVHVTNNDPKRLQQALQDIEGLMHYYQDNGQRARVEVVANGLGLDLLRSDTSKFVEQIARLQKQYSNLKFAACQNTIDHVREEQGIQVPLLPGVIVIDSGMAEIMRRQTEGWTYLQV